MWGRDDEETQSYRTEYVLLVNALVIMGINASVKGWILLQANPDTADVLPTTVMFV